MSGPTPLHKYQPSFYRAHVVEIIENPKFDSPEGYVRLNINCDPNISHHENGISYRIFISLSIDEVEDHVDKLPYFITMSASCAFVTDGYTEENDDWIFENSFYILYNLMAGDIASMTSKFGHDSFVPPAIDLTEALSELKICLKDEEQEVIS